MRISRVTSTAGALGAGCVLFSLAGCGGSPRPSAPAPEAAAEDIVDVGYGTLPPELDRVLRDYERAWRGRDSTALAALFTVDGFVLQSGRPPVRGRDAIRSLYAGQTGDPLRLRALAYATSDTVGYIIGAYGFGDDPNDTGKFTLTLRRARGGAWLIASDMDNVNQRPRRP